MPYRYRNPAHYDCAADFYSDVEADADRAEGDFGGSDY